MKQKWANKGWGMRILNLDEYTSRRTHQVAFDVNGSNAAYLDCFSVEHISKELNEL